ncbi:MAG: hypothetical protein RL757_2955 [Bacteroidota bacterium]|jgi:putative endonuclease
MKKQTQQLGQDGEQAATDFLTQNGLAILARNWRFGRAEIDIIAQQADQTLVFVEVKTRSDNTFAAPQDAVSMKKQALTIKAAFAYMRDVGHEWKFRFDIIAVIKKEENFYITHLTDAFFPEI